MASLYPLVVLAAGLCLCSDAFTTPAHRGRAAFVTRSRGRTGSTKERMDEDELVLTLRSLIYETAGVAADECSVDDIESALHILDSTALPANVETSRLEVWNHFRELTKKPACRAMAIARPRPRSSKSSQCEVIDFEVPSGLFPSDDSTVDDWLELLDRMPCDEGSRVFRYNPETDSLSLSFFDEAWNLRTVQWPWEDRFWGLYASDRMCASEW